MGGLKTIVLCMKNHVGNPAIMKEASRMLCALATNPKYAKMIAESGALELCFDFLQKNPEQCGVHALNVINAVTKNCPEAIERCLNHFW